MLYGRHPILELLRARPGQIEHIAFVTRDMPSANEGILKTIATTASAHRIPLEDIDRHMADRLSQGAPHQGVFARLRPFAYVDLLPWVASLKHTPLIVALDHIQDPHNLGALARSALALGAQGLVVPKDRSAQVTSSAFKASAGALAHLSVARVTNLARSLTQLADEGLQIIGTHLEMSTTPQQVDWTLPSVLVIGNEQSGLRPSTLQRCQQTIRIPIETIGSLNASVAGAICLYEARRQRQNGPNANA